jgi:hypothetical protein
MEPIQDLFHKSSSKHIKEYSSSWQYPSLQYNTTVSLFITPNHICIYHQNHIKFAGRVCIDCTIRGSVMSQRKGITIVVMIAT